MEIDLIKEEIDSAETEGYITPLFAMAQGSMSTTDKNDTFTISLGGDNNLYFTFGKGKRRVKTHLGKILMQAYRLATEE